MSPTSRDVADIHGLGIFNHENVSDNLSDVLSENVGHDE